MKLNVERKPASLVVLDITAEEHEFAEALSKAVRKVSKDIQMPGFRKGKAPRGIIERFYGRDVFLREAADEVMDRLYRDAITQESITPVGEPSVEIVELEPVNFVVTVPVYPEVDPKDYAAVRVGPVDAAVTDEDVEEIVERLRKAQSPWVDVTDERIPGEGDQVTIDYEVKDGDTAFQDPVTDAVFVLGETNLLTQLRDKIETMKVGETDSFDLAFDEDDETADPGIRGKSLSYSVTLKSIKERDLIAMDDEFAKTAAEAESLDGLRDQIREDLHQGRTNEGRTGVLNDIIDAIAAQSEVDPPQVMIDEEVEHQLSQFKENLQRSNTPYEGYLRLQNKTDDDVKADVLPEATRRLRNSLLLQAIARAEAVELTDEDIDTEIEAMTPVADDATDEQREQANRMKEFYKSDYFRNMLRNELFERKLTDRLIEIATEGQGAVTNGWVATPLVTSKPAASASTSTDDDSGSKDADGTDEVDDPKTAASSSTGNNSSSSKLPTEGEGTDWVAGDGTETVPDGFPIKGNASSKIYHPIESPAYENTIAEIYFATPEGAGAAGYRAPKNLQHAGSDAASGASDGAGKVADADPDDSGSTS